MAAVVERSLNLQLYVAPKRETTRTRVNRLDRSMPVWDASRVERLVIDATPETLYNVTLNTDFMDAVRSSRVVRMLFGVRAAAEHIIARLRFAARPRPFSPSAIRVGSLPLRGEWVTLGQEWPTEIAFGAIGKFWAGETKFLRTDASVFRSFATSGFAKIACHFTFRPLGDGRTLVTYEARTNATDAASRRAFLRYWRVVSPFVGVVMRAMLTTIERNARRV